MNTTDTQTVYPIPDGVIGTVIGGGTDYYGTEFSADNFKQGAGWPTGDTLTIEDADYVVTNAEQLNYAIEHGNSNDVIWICEWCEIDGDSLNTPLYPKEGMVIASNRGQGGSQGALISVDEFVFPLIDIRQPNVRITGLRLEAHQKEYIDWPGYDANKHATGISINADNIEIDNVAGSGWGHAVIETGRHGDIEKTHIHHCALTDNPLGGLGYGVTVFRGDPLIQYCYLDNNRHSIAGDGYEECGYIARYNVVGEKAVGHSFDMHDGSGPIWAGKRLSIHHNTFYMTYDYAHDTPEEAIAIRGKPREGFQCLFNRFAHDVDGEVPDPGGQGDPIRVDNTDSFKEAGGVLKINGVDTNTYNGEEAGVPSDILTAT